MFFHNRSDAGQALAKQLGLYADREDVMILGIPRGGVVVAGEVASVLNAPLDIFVVRKLGVPGHEELAFGAVASGGVRILDRELIEAMELSTREIERVTRTERAELQRRETVYRGDRPALKVKGLTVLVVDDGIATGSSMLAGIRALRQLSPARIVVAAPVAPESTCKRLRGEVDDLVCVYTPQLFHAIGQFYEDFSQVTDEEVIGLLERSRSRTAVPAA
jgi:putative phosphoribosyl transferase